VCHTRQTTGEFFNEDQRNKRRKKERKKEMKKKWGENDEYTNIVDGIMQ
jgi:hypothetical protein